MGILVALVAIGFEVNSLNLDLIVFSVSVLIGEDIFKFFVFPVQDFQLRYLFFVVLFHLLLVLFLVMFWQPDLFTVLIKWQLGRVFSSFSLVIITLD